MALTDEQVRMAARAYLTAERTRAGRVVVRGEDEAWRRLGLDVRLVLTEDPGVLRVAEVIRAEAESLRRRAEAHYARSGL